MNLLSYHTRVTRSLTYYSKTWFFYLQKMDKSNKSVRNMEIAIQRKARCFGKQHVHKVSNQSDQKEVPKCDEWLYSEKYSADNTGHNSVMISGLLMFSGIIHFYRKWSM